MIYFPQLQARDFKRSIRFCKFTALIAALLIAVGLSPMAHAQFRASIQGTVTDTQGGVIPGAKLTLTSNAAGNFYATQPVAFPATVWLQKGALGGGMTAPAGSCNACHTPSFRMTIR